MNIKDIGSWLLVMGALAICGGVVYSPVFNEDMKLMALTAIVGVLSAGVGYFLRGRVEQES